MSPAQINDDQAVMKYCRKADIGLSHIQKELREKTEAGKVEFKTDAGGNVQAPVGRASFSSEALTENLTTFLDHIESLRPAAVKGQYLRKVSVSTTMSPGLRVAYGE